LGYDNERTKGDHKHYFHRQIKYKFMNLEKLRDDFEGDVENIRRIYMATKKVRITIRSLKESSEEFKEVAREIDKGIFKPRTPTIGFENFDVYIRAFTPKRMELLQKIISKKPKTISELARITNRDFKNVHSDIKLLEEYDLVKLKKTNSGLMPVALYDEIDIDIKISLTMWGCKKVRPNYLS